MYISGKKRGDKDDDADTKVSGDDEDFVLGGSEKAKIHHKDEDEGEEEKKTDEEKKKDIKSRLVRTKNQRKNMKRELTGHVVT